MNRFPFAIKYYRGSRPEKLVFSSFEEMDKTYRDFKAKGVRCQAYEVLESGIILDAYTGRQV